VLGGIPDAVVTFDRDWRFLYVNHRAAELTGRPAEQLLGRSLWELFPNASGTLVHGEFHRAMAEQRPIVFEEHGQRAGRWLEHRLFPTQDGLTVWSRDVTERRHAEQTRAVLLEVARDIAETPGLDELLTKVQARLRDVLACDVVVAFRFDATTGMFRVLQQEGCAPALAADLGALTFRPFEPFGGRLAEGPVVVTRGDAPEVIERLCAHFGWSSLMVAPLRLHDRQLGALAVTFAGPRGIAEWERELCAGVAHQLAVALTRDETHRTEQDDAAVAAALARLGHQLLSASDRPRLLDRVSALTAEALGCAASATFLWSPEEEAFMAVGSYGLSATQAEEIRLLGIAPGAIPNLLRRLAQEDVFVQSDLAEEERGAIPSRLHPPPGSVMLFWALRRGEHVIGFQVATQAPVRRPFTAVQLRIARGAVQLASMAVEHGHVLDQLERANRLKSDFVAMMSHELRTPLHVILGYGDLLLDGAFGELAAPAIDALQRMQRSSKDLLELVREMLDLNRLESGRMPVHLAPVVPAELLAEVGTYCADIDRAPEVVLRTSCDVKLPAVVTDRAKVVTILRNLIGNALKFTKEGVVEATIGPADGAFCLTVSDTGEGIAPELVPHVFEPFRQGDTRTTRPHGGVGLGLYIVRRMVDSLGGTLAVDSEPGHGTTFRVVLPDGHPPLLEEHGRLKAMLATTSGEAAIVDSEGVVIAVNDRWLRYAAENGAKATDRLGVGANYFAVCARAYGPDAAVAAEASRGLREVLEGRREPFALEYVCDSPTGRWPYRLQVSALDGAAHYALVSHVRVAAGSPAPPR
jgi:PAS domain S-box-containing protein